MLSQNAWLPVLRYVGANQWNGGRIMVSKAHTVFNQDGTLMGQKIEEQFQRYQGFAAFARANWNEHPFPEINPLPDA